MMTVGELLNLLNDYVERMPEGESIPITAFVNDEERDIQAVYYSDTHFIVALDDTYDRLLQNISESDRPWCGGDPARSPEREDG